MAQEIQVVNDKDFAETKAQVDEQQKKVVETKAEIKKDMVVQTSSFKDRLAARKM